MTIAAGSWWAVTNRCPPAPTCCPQPAARSCLLSSCCVHSASGAEVTAKFSAGVAPFHVVLVRNMLAMFSVKSNKAVSGLRRLTSPSRTHVTLISKLLFYYYRFWEDVLQREYPARMLLNNNNFKCTKWKKLKITYFRLHWDDFF